MASLKASTRRKTLQTNFSGGEIAPDISLRQDTTQYENGALSLRNRRCLIGGGTKRRPGTWRGVELPDESRLEEFVVNESTKYILAFYRDGMSAYLVDVATGFVTAAGSISGTDWNTDDIVAEFDYAQAGNTCFITHQDMVTQVLLRTSASTWSASDLSYATGPASRLEQPYLKFVDPEITLACSDVTGSITLTASSAVFVAAHVGQYVRYVERACLITAVAAGGLSCTATVVERLPETQDLTVTASTLFAVGEVVEGETTGARGLITSIPDGTSIFVVIIDGLTQFAAENLIGPNSTTAISSVVFATNAAVTDWDEQMFGAVYGYPGAVELHRNRLILGGHATAPEYMVASGLGNLFNFNVGDGSDADAIIESIGDAGASRIVQFHSAEQLLVLTDKGPYYVPENAVSPFRPSSIAFFPFGSPWSISSKVKAKPFDDGVLFATGGVIIKATPTGDVQRAWIANEVSLLASHLFDNPFACAVTSNFSGGPERYAAFVNEDGMSMAVMQIVDAQEIRNVTPWDTEGRISGVAGLSGYLYIATVRTIGGDTRWYLELFDQDLTLDLASELADLDDIPGIYGSTSVNVVVDNFHLGLYELPDGLSSSNPPSGPYIVGLDYEAEIQTLPPIITDGEGEQAGDFMRILEALVFVQSSARFAAEGHELTAYQIGDDFSEAPLRDGPQRFQFLGWERQPTLTITQSDPLRLDIQAIKQVVAY